MQTSEDVLNNSGKEYNNQDVKHATHYLLSEIAFIEFAVSYFGLEKVLYTYHRPWRVYEDYIAGIFDGAVKYHLDFILLEAPYETYLSPEENTQTRLDTIKQRWYIQCGYTQYNPDFFNKSDRWFVGVFYDAIVSVGKILWVDIRFTEQSGYGVINQRINDGAIDVFCAPVWPTTSRKLEMFFTHSFAQSNVYWYIKIVNIMVWRLWNCSSRKILGL